MISGHIIHFVAPFPIYFSSYPNTSRCQTSAFEPLAARHFRRTYAK
jgi:hypothetical protein